MQTRLIITPFSGALVDIAIGEIGDSTSGMINGHEGGWTRLPS
jgi:hypothetical protein